MRMLLAVAAGAAGWACDETCRDAARALCVEVQFASADLRNRTESLVYEATYAGHESGPQSLRRTAEPKGSCLPRNELSEAFGLPLDAAELSGTGDVEVGITVTARSAEGAALAQGALSVTNVSNDACTRAFMMLGGVADVDGGVDPVVDTDVDRVADVGVDTGVDPVVDTGVDPVVDTGIDPGLDTGVDRVVDVGVDTGVDAGVDTGVDTGVDGGVEQCPFPEPASGELSAVPNVLQARWVDVGTQLEFTVQVCGGVGVELETLTVESSAAFPVIDTGPLDPNLRTFTVTIDTSDLQPGAVDRESITVAADGAGAPLEIPFDLRFFQPVHVGPEPDACARGPVVDCDFEGINGLIEASASVQSLSFRHIVLHSGGRRPAFYPTGASGVSLGNDTWMSSADGVAAQVVAHCEAAQQGLLVTGDRVRIEGFTVLGERFCNFQNGAEGEGAVIVSQPDTGDLEIDRMIVTTLVPEAYGFNNMRRPFVFRGATRLTNSHVYGFWEGVGDFSEASGSTLSGNTVVLYQAYGLSTIVALGTDDLSIVNNVFVAPSEVDTPFIEANSETDALIFDGNVVDGFSGELTTGQVDTGGVRAPIGTADVESPHTPMYLRDAQATVSAEHPSVGVSLDGVPISGRTDTLPGAFQVRSDLTERRSVIRLGPSTCSACDRTISDGENEVQLAAWSLWPGGRLELEGGDYAGSLVISWPVSISGPRDAPETVRFDGRIRENLLWQQGGLWDNHGAVVAVTREALGTTIEGVTILTEGSSAPGHALVLEGASTPEPISVEPTVRNVIMRTLSPNGTTLGSAVRAGSRTLLQDVLIEGVWPVCARAVVWGPPNENEQPQPVSASFVNVTCRLTGPARAGFEIARIQNSFFVNLALEVSPASPTTSVFAVQPRVGATDPNPADVPTSFEAHSVHYRGFGGLSAGFTVVEPDPNFELVSVADPGEDLFVSPTDSRLANGSVAIDSGTQPVDLPVTGFAAGVSIDGQSRGSRMIDRGAYETGQ